MVNRLCVIASTLATAVWLSGAGAAHATGTIECTGVSDPDTEVFVLIGRVPVLAVLRAQISIGGDVYATRQPGFEAPEGSIPIVFGQGFADLDGLRIDFTDEGVSEITVSLRTVIGDGDKAFAEAGVLTARGSDVAAVTCERG